MVIAFIVGWAICGVLAFGITVADFWHSFPTLQREPGRFRDIAGFASIYAALGPLGFIIVFLVSGFAKHGLLFRQPRSAS